MPVEQQFRVSTFAWNSMIRPPLEPMPQLCRQSRMKVAGTYSRFLRRETTFSVRHILILKR